MTIGITGHQDIPDQALDFVEKHIRQVLSTYPDLQCVSSLAVGADQLFARLALEHAAVLHAVIPSEHYETTFTNQRDQSQYQALLKQAHITETLDFAQPSEEAFLRAGMRVADLSELLIAVWDGEGVQGKGGTADIVAYARQREKPVIIVWPQGVKR
jgi:hypothetical protein